MLINTTSLTPNTGFRRSNAIVARAAEVLVLGIAIERLGDICFAEGAQVAVIRIVGLVAADLLDLDKAGDMFELAAFRTANAGHSGVVVLPLANAEDRAF